MAVWGTEEQIGFLMLETFKHKEKSIWGEEKTEKNI